MQCKKAIDQPFGERSGISHVNASSSQTCLRLGDANRSVPRQTTSAPYTGGKLPADTLLNQLRLARYGYN
ncbi:hypothetical protein XAB3213_1940002 [Xanthomonas citri pv. bilvae]|nr:hypothetical protein XAB3213_1940002 [Xanthomonas citri pv. bilvae]